MIFCPSQLSHLLFNRTVLLTSFPWLNTGAAAAFFCVSSHDLAYKLVGQIRLGINQCLTLVLQRLDTLCP